jgi:hypothetical protein
MIPSDSSSSSSSNGGGSSYDTDDDSDSVRGPAGHLFQRDPLEDEMNKAIRKAKLLARIDQLAGRGVKPSKNFTYRAPEDELIVEVARMETLAQRAVRIQQGRAAFISMVGTSEKGMNAADDTEMLPFNFYMNGFTRQTVKDITNYDDCLERGVESMLGSGGSFPWYVELAFILVPAMVTHSMMNRFKDNPEHTKKVLQQDPQLRTEVAKELAHEMHRTERAKILEDEERRKKEAARFSAPPQTSSASAPPPQRRRMRAPPPLSSGQSNPGVENIEADPVQTAHMRQEMEQNNALLRQRGEIDAQNRRIQQLENDLAVANTKAGASTTRGVPPQRQMQLEVAPPLSAEDEVVIE